MQIPVAPLGTTSVIVIVLVVVLEGLQSSDVLKGAARSETAVSTSQSVRGETRPIEDEGDEYDYGAHPYRAP